MNYQIRNARKAAGMTQAQLALLIGVNRATLSRYESGDIDPPSSQLQKIAAALGVDWLELCGEPTERDRAAILSTVREIGLPHGPDGSVSVAETKQLLQRVSEVYGEKAALLLKLISIMNDEGVDKVIGYTRDIFQEHMDEGTSRA